MTEKQENMFYNNLGLVKKIAHKYLFSTQSMEYDDLYQVGCKGLIKAIYNFDDTLGYQFSTFAVTYIKHEILNEIQHNDKLIRIPPVMQKFILDYEKEKEFKDVDVDEFIQRNDCYKFGFYQALNANKSYSSFDCAIETKDNDFEDLSLLEILPDTYDLKDTSLYYDEFVFAIRKTLTDLGKKCSERNMNILKLYFGLGCEEHTYKEIGELYNISGERARQIIDKILKTLRTSNEHLKDYLEICENYELLRCEDEYEYQ